MQIGFNIHLASAQQEDETGSRRKKINGKSKEKIDLYADFGGKRKWITRKNGALMLRKLSNWRL